MSASKSRKQTSNVVAPAPWLLRGQGYLFAVKMPDDELTNSVYTPEPLRDSRRSPLSFAMLVDYQESPVGPYQELLFIPGSFRFGEKRYPSITRILVSTQESVDNGRRNWGIPKDRCDFKMSLDGSNTDHARLTTDDGQLIAEMTLSSRGPNLPMPTQWAPDSLRTIAQLWQGRQFTLAPAVKGQFRWGKVLEWQFNPELFPDLAKGRCIAALKISSFEMVFPEASIKAWTSESPEPA